MSDKNVRNIVIGAITIAGLLITKDWWCLLLGLGVIAICNNDDNF